MGSELIDEIRDYCAAVGISPSTLGVRAVGSSRFFDRLQRKVEKAAEDAAKVRRFMMENPPPKAAVDRATP